jgi:hypothetical protein
MKNPQVKPPSVDLACLFSKEELDFIYESVVIRIEEDEVRRSCLKFLFPFLLPTPRRGEEHVASVNLDPMSLKTFHLIILSLVLNLEDLTFRMNDEGWKGARLVLDEERKFNEALLTKILASA